MPAPKRRPELEPRGPRRKLLAPGVCSPFIWPFCASGQRFSACGPCGYSWKEISLSWPTQRLYLSLDFGKRKVWGQRKHPRKDKSRIEQRMSQKRERGWKGEEWAGTTVEPPLGWGIAAPHSGAVPTLYWGVRESSSPQIAKLLTWHLFWHFPLPVAWGRARWTVWVCRWMQDLWATLEWLVGKETHKFTFPFAGWSSGSEWETGKSECQCQYLFTDKEINGQAVSESGYVGGGVGVGTWEGISGLLFGAYVTWYHSCVCMCVCVCVYT